MKSLTDHERTLLQHVRDELRKEENAVAIYLGHLAAVMTRTGLSHESVAQIRAVLERIARTNRRHIQVLDGLVAPEKSS